MMFLTLYVGFQQNNFSKHLKFLNSILLNINFNIMKNVRKCIFFLSLTKLILKND